MSLVRHEMRDRVALITLHDPQRRNALSLALMTGMHVFVATNWLELKGGEPNGPHLALLGQFLPGYSVSFLGSLVGLAYGAALGAAAGWSIAWIYNRLAFRKR